MISFPLIFIKLKYSIYHNKVQLNNPRINTQLIYINFLKFWKDIFSSLTDYLTNNYPKIF